MQQNEVLRSMYIDHMHAGIRPDKCWLVSHIRLSAAQPQPKI